MTIRDLIHSLGGPAKVAKDLGFEGKKGGARVSMWIKRDRIPAMIQLKHQSYFNPKKSRKATKTQASGQ